jgi:hypothetical protein
MRRYPVTYTQLAVGDFGIGTPGGGVLAPALPPLGFAPALPPLELAPLVPVLPAPASAAPPATPDPDPERPPLVALVPAPVPPLEGALPNPPELSGALPLTAAEQALSTKNIAANAEKDRFTKAVMSTVQVADHSFAVSRNSRSRACVECRSVTTH